MNDCKPNLCFTRKMHNKSYNWYFTFSTQNILSLWCQSKAKIHYRSSPGTKSDFTNLKYIKVSLIKNIKFAHSFE